MRVWTGLAERLFRTAKRERVLEDACLLRWSDAESSNAMKAAIKDERRDESTVETGDERSDARSDEGDKRRERQNWKVTDKIQVSDFLDPGYWKRKLTFLSICFCAKKSDFPEGPSGELSKIFATRSPRIRKEQNYDGEGYGRAALRCCSKRTTKA